MVQTFGIQKLARRDSLAMESGMARTTSIQEPLNGKVHWDASEEEVREWLDSKHGITNDEADAMIAIAFRVKASTIRKICLVRATVATIAGCILIAFAWVGWRSEGRRTRSFGIAAAIAGFSCLGYAGKNFFSVISGKSDVAIDA